MWMTNQSAKGLGAALARRPGTSSRRHLRRPCISLPVGPRMKPLAVEQICTDLQCVSLSRQDGGGKKKRKDGYGGWEGGSPIEVIQASSLTPEDFHERFVKARKPVLLEGHLEDPEWHATERWSSDNRRLRELAGSATVLVERRSAGVHAFGMGKRVPMPFSQFLHKLEKGSDQYYLTSQASVAHSRSRSQLPVLARCVYARPPLPASPPST